MVCPGALIFHFSNYSSSVVQQVGTFRKDLCESGDEIQSSTCPHVKHFDHY